MIQNKKSEANIKSLQDNILEIKKVEVSIAINKAINIIIKFLIR